MVRYWKSALIRSGTLAHVAENSRPIAASLGSEDSVPVRVIWKPALATADAVRQLSTQANSAKNCVGLELWMHTFSPAKMWIAGLNILVKPILHLHTQFDRGLPWSTIDMDLMNLNQAAHGDREFGFMTARMRLARKVIVGFWKDPDTVAETRLHEFRQRLRANDYRMLSGRQLN